MKKFLIAGLAMLTLFGVASAAPNTTFNWTLPLNYEDGSVITGDPLDIILYCGNTSGGPYNFTYAVGTDISVIALLDVGSCVQGVPGTYFFVSTATSTLFGTTSIFSNETQKTYTAGDLGKVPLPPAVLSVT
jgi:hypothetical protein